MRLLLGIGIGDEYFSLGTGFENIKLSIKRIRILESLVQKQVSDSYFPPILKQPCVTLAKSEFG
tara:strand:- start:292 stop:483 length:192 start_codon:yes stop_codon:yes gene_type:complete